MARRTAILLVAVACGIAGAVAPATAGAAPRCTVSPVTRSVHALRAMRLRACITSRGVVWVRAGGPVAVDVTLQARVAAQLAVARLPRARMVAAQSLAVFGTRLGRRAAAGTPLLPLVSATAVAARAAHALGAGSGTGASVLVTYTRLRLAIADRSGWSRIDGRVATLDEQRTLALRAGALAAASGGDRALRARAAHFAAELRTPPVLSFRALPSGAFYPWPHDGVLDSAAASVSIDKPGTVGFVVYDGTGQVVHSVVTAVSPGTWTATWAGDAGAQTAAPGEYRYVLRAIDLAGNRRVLPGLGAFVVARDTEPPTIRAATSKYLGGALRRRIAVSWNALERLSPQLHGWVALRGGGLHRLIDLGPVAAQGSAVLGQRLPAGTYRVFVRIADGSGNIREAAAGTVAVG